MIHTFVVINKCLFTYKWEIGVKYKKLRKRLKKRIK